MMNPQLSILIPCLNEGAAIGAVVREFREAFPQARILVVDNGSSDTTTPAALEAGAEVVNEPVRGKSYAVRRGFEVLCGSWILMVDGDGSYPVEGAILLWKSALENPADLLTGVRRASPEGAVFRPGHQAGTRAFSACLSLTFGHRPRDLFSGLRLFSPRFTRTIPILSRGFELEMELTIQALEKGLATREIDVPFRERAHGGQSKLRTLRDGLHILVFLILLFRDWRPMIFFTILGLLTAAASLVAGSFPVVEYFQTGLIGRFPLAILAAALMNLAVMLVLIGLVLESHLRSHREAFQIRLRNSPT